LGWFVKHNALKVSGYHLHVQTRTH